MPALVSRFVSEVTLESNNSRRLIFKFGLAMNNYSY